MEKLFEALKVFIWLDVAIECIAVIVCLVVLTVMVINLLRDDS